jgi:hypothetical protein
LLIFLTLFFSNQVVGEGGFGKVFKVQLKSICQEFVPKQQEVHLTGGEKTMKNK